MSVLLISTYDMGRQPFGLASPAAWLSHAGLGVVCLDLAKERFSDAAVRQASTIGFFLPMHTATRLALPVIARVRRLNPNARIVAYGLYAPLNELLLRERGVHDVLGGEFEAELVQAALKGCATEDTTEVTPTPEPRVLPRLSFKVPLRSVLPPLSNYATLQDGAERRTVGYTEASRGCKHRCRHCPIVPVYDGRFRIVSSDVVVADARAQVDAGARHITFGDPDFFNGIRHARDVVERFGRVCPGVTYDVTIKIEHLLQHSDALPLLRDTGCAFVTSAVESLDDTVLAILEKGHTRADFERAIALCHDVRLPLSPTFVAFTPWTTVAGFLELLHEIDRLDLVDHVSPIQYAIRLLVPHGSRMLEVEGMRRVAGPFDPVSLTHPWRHPDPRVDQLHASMTRLVGVNISAPRREVFGRVWDEAHTFAARIAPMRVSPPMPRATVPYLNEPWYC
ncbi:MAG TPA: CUAEP/CCAEP-tail radical SAM protein [Vicinamibacterales bacterium]|nr:CUAEP/CCAEP-tail radical SAM protein [Vicinamibacterales bacterium]